MGYSVVGTIKDTNGDVVEGVVILPYFKKVDSGSSDSVWSTETYTTDSNGYYSYSPEDSNLLGSEGSYKKSSDKFYCAYLVGGGETLTSLDLTQAMFHAHTIPNDDDLQIDLTLEDVRVPILDSSVFPNAVLTKHRYTMSEESYADTSWKSADYGEDRSQKLVYDNVAIFDGHQLIDTIYTWGEVDDREVINNTNDSYTFDTAGNYTLKIKVREKWNTFIEVTQDVTVKYNEPVLDFSWDPDNDVVGNVEVAFTNSTTDLDDRSGDYTYEWVISDTDIDDEDTTETVSDAELEDLPTHTFTSAGSKQVTLKCYWNDGFDDQTVELNKTVEVIEYTVTPQLTWNNPVDRADTVTFTDNTIDEDDVMINWDINIKDYYAVYNPDNTGYGNATTDNEVVVEDINEGGNQTHEFQAYDTHEVTITVEYNTGWETKRVSQSYNIDPSKYAVQCSIATDPLPVDGGWVGKVPVDYSSELTGEGDNGIEEEWKWDDVQLDDTSTVTTRSEQTVGDAQEFTYQHPSRKPYCAVDGATEANVNKEVSLTVRYDDGWEDNILCNSTELYEAIPYEISSSITYECNIEGYTHS